MGKHFKPFGICVAGIGLTIILITILPSGALWFILGMALIVLGLNIMRRF